MPLEPVTAFIVGNFLWETFGQSIAGSEAHTAYKQLSGKLLQRFRDGTLPVNDHILHALLKSLAASALVFAYTLHDPQRRPLRDMLTDPRQWLELLNRSTELVQRNILEQQPTDYWLSALVAAAKVPGNFADFNLHLVLDDNQISAVVRDASGGALRDHVHEEFILWTTRHIPESRIKPPEFDTAVRAGLTLPGYSTRTLTFYEVFRQFVREELKEDEQVHRAYVIDILAELHSEVRQIASQIQSPPDRDEFQALLQNLRTFAGYQAELHRQNEQFRADVMQEFAKLHQAISNLPSAVVQELKKSNLVAPPSSPGYDISRIDRYAPEDLIGRESELALLGDAWKRAAANEPRRPHILTIVAMGGEGKTSLVAKWLANLAYNDWPNCESAFAWSFYSQGASDQSTASSDAFLAAALTFFGDEQTANSPKHATEKAKRLAELISQRRTILVLDGVEPLQYPPGPPHDGRLKDDGLAALLKKLAAGKHQSLCVVTTRYTLPDLKNFRQTTAPEIDLKRLSTEAGVALLKHLEVRGTNQEYKRLVEDTKGHALTLNLLGAYLRDAHAGDIRRRDRVKLAEADAEVQGGHAFRVMDSYVQWLKSKSENKPLTAILRLLGLFDRPATADCLSALCRAPVIAGLTEPLVNMSDAHRNLAIKRLDAMKLLAINRSSAGDLVALDAHPLIREYFARHLRDKSPAAASAAHQRVYEHLCASTHYKDEPTLADLQPLYQAVVHGCLAGLQQETCENVYFRLIHRGPDAYSMKKLGAAGADLGAIACFFDEPWILVSSSLTEPVKAWLLNEAATRLLALGRLTEALETLKTSRDLCIQQEDWREVTVRTYNLSDCELMLGDVAAATKSGEQCVIYSKRSRIAFQRIMGLSMYANGLHYYGKLDDAHTLFREAEQIQAESQLEYPLIYSLHGFQYCDLLLTGPEVAAWQSLLNHQNQCSNSTLIQNCVAVYQRAARTLKWTELNRASHLSIALDHLTLGRAALYQGLLAQSKIENGDSVIDQAVDGFRRAGDATRVPLGLLARSCLRKTSNDSSGAQADLDEAYEIAERGPMRLHMADIHLYRARLFFREPEYPWADWDRWQTDKSDTSLPNPRTADNDLAAARDLIEECGYGRRLPELEDAEAALKAWQQQPPQPGN